MLDFITKIEVGKSNKPTLVAAYNKNKALRICAKWHLSGILHNLFEGLIDKDETVRTAIKSSLIKILETHPARATDILVDYRERNPKLPEQTVITLLKAIERVVNSDTAVPSEASKKLITLAIAELTRSSEHQPHIQDHALTILVAIGRKECNAVMEALMANTKEGAVAHFMVMQCLGAMATANVAGVVPFIKPILATILPNLGGIKHDHIKQAHAYAIGHFSEALLEHSSTHGAAAAATAAASTTNGELPPTSTAPAETTDVTTDCATEISVAYDVLFNQWLNSREPKVCVEILQALSSMYPLLPVDKIQDQSPRLIPQILALYRRSIERNSVTQFLSSVLKTNITLQPSVLDTVAEPLISNLFDLVCVFPDYEKPQTVKGHYEVLRCFHLLSGIYAVKIVDTLLIHLRNNSERDRIKSLLILTHLMNTSTAQIEDKIHGFLECIKSMIVTEKSIKMKMTLLKTIVALSQKGFIKEKEFVWFVIRYSCKYTKVNQEHGSLEEHANFVLSCENSLFMLSSTAGTMDELLKRELLNYFVLLDYTDVCSNLAKCLASLFSKSPSIEYEIAADDEGDEKREGAGEEQGKEIGQSNIKSGKIIVPCPESIFGRCLALLGHSVKRSSNILSFLKYYYPHLNPELNTLWDKRIPDLLLHINKEPVFSRKLIEFITETVEYLNAHDENFAERLVNKMSDQLNLYPINTPHTEFVVPTLSIERGMLLKSLALALCFVTELQTINAKIDMIINSARQEKLDKHVKHAEYEQKIAPCAVALGYISRKHLTHLIKKLAELAHIGGRKHSTGFFSNLHFIKDTHKEQEMYKTNLLVIKSFGHILDESDPVQSLQNLDDTILNFLILQLTGTKDQTIMSAILKTLLSICNQIIATKEQLTAPLKYRKQIMEAVFSIPIEAPFNDLPLLPTILKLGTDFIRIGGVDTTESVDGSVIFEIACKNFFSCAQHLKIKFDSPEEDERNSFLAKHLNESLPELNALAKAITETDPSPSTLDLIISILESWTRDKNSEVRICASHVFNNALDVYIKTMKIGCEAPSKFNQTGQMLGKIVPRCIDSNGTVRQVSVDILQKTLEISCIYETLTIADSETDWVKEIELVKEQIITDDPKMIYHLAGEIAKVISLRMSNFQYLQFCKTLLQGLRDPEQSSSIGASVVLKFFVQHKGSELFHAIPDLVKESLSAVRDCEINRARSGVLKALVALTKHHPKLVCFEMLTQPLPYENNIVEYWHLVASDAELTGALLDNFLQILSSSCLYEPNEAPATDRQKIASIQPFAIFCALKEIMPCKDIKEELYKKFPELFTMMLTSLATYTNLAPPMQTGNQRSSSPTHSGNNASTSSLSTVASTTKSRFGFVPNKDLIKLNPCQIVLDTFQAFLGNLEMEQIATVLTVHTQLASSTDLKNFIELLTPTAIGLVNQLQISSSIMKQVVTALSKYVSSPYDGQRIAAVGLFSRLVPLKPCGEISSVIMLHLSSALSDPNAVVRGLSIQGFGYVGNLTEHDIEKYTETAVTALLKGIDDTVSDCLINIPLESMRGLARILQTLPSDRLESFHVSLAIRIRPFFGSYSIEIREASIILFGDLCESKKAHDKDGSMSPNSSSTEALREQLIANLFPILLHLSEGEATIIRACKGTLRKVCGLLNAPKVNEMAQRHLIDHGQLNYGVFIVDFVKLIAMDLPDHIQDFIDSAIPKLRSQWAEVRGSAAIVIGILHNFLPERNTQTESVGNKLAALLKDENHFVRVKAATALGYFFGDI
ncbi:maestro heat-like repeat-containing protein family member 1 isoform X1 [Anastrepha ludens]|uniref:maestro heat-like repeat-containing protein family member 1 isoform X1 n=1 Tax=Anastrepha ludens TaxID=28586 RepID=UPI0023AE838A|nr:maestro heat-like repeat-containing protein family member 1 isoform X1 [Anastrepha ludens]